MNHRAASRAVQVLLLGHALLAAELAAGQEKSFRPVDVPEWVRHVHRMVFITPGEIEVAEKVRAQVVHTNVVWPYHPLRREGGGLFAADARRLKDFVEACHHRGMKVVLGLPPFMPVALAKAHPDWRVHPDDSGAILKVEPREDDLGTRSGCNLGPWGDYLIEVLAELLADYHLNGYSFDGNYHPPLCFCPACKAAYRSGCGLDLPKKADLDDLAYRSYLVWRGERLEDHYRRMQVRLKAVNRDAVLMSWTVNAGRYGHLLTSPRAMPTRLNLLFDLPMQEWWLDETNLGASIAPSFAVAYLRGIVGGRPNGSEPYLMSRGNPYSSDSFPAHERITRALLAMTYGSQPPQAIWLGDQGASMAAAFAEIDRRARWVEGARPMPWAAMLVSEQTRQFHVYGDIAERFLPHLFGVFRALTEAHMALDLINDWDLDAARLAKYRVLVLPGAAALSDRQVEAVRQYVREGGGLVATCETSLGDELGRPRPDFALADVFGVSYRGRPARRTGSGAADAKAPVAFGPTFWKDRVGVARIAWTGHPFMDDGRLAAMVPSHGAVFKGPLVAVSEPQAAGEVAARFAPEVEPNVQFPAAIVRPFGKGRVVYLAAGVDAALWSYAYPYQRRLMARAVEWAAQTRFPIEVAAPMCVQATFWEDGERHSRRTVVQLFNSLNTTAGHGLPTMDVPLREETVPIHGIKVKFFGQAPRQVHVEPGSNALPVRHEAEAAVVELPPLAVHCLVVAE